VPAEVVKYSKHTESRGEIYTLYNRNTLLRKTSILKKNLDFKQDKVSVSYKGVIRGFHGDNDTCKLITCLDGIIQLVVYDVDKNSKQQFILDSFKCTSVS
jgi:dTDP-4-dehydrorhamnose 3,5-epimerase